MRAGELLKRVERKLRVLVPAGSVVVPAADVAGRLEMMSEAMAEWTRRTLCYRGVTATFDTVIDQQGYDIEAFTVKMASIREVHRGTTRLMRVSNGARGFEDELGQYSDWTSSGVPRSWAMVGETSLRLGPIPAAVETITVKGCGLQPVFVDEDSVVRAPAAQDFDVVEWCLCWMLRDSEIEGWQPRFAAIEQVALARRGESELKELAGGRRGSGRWSGGGWFS